MRLAKRCQNCLYWSQIPRDRIPARIGGWILGICENPSYDTLSAFMPESMPLYRYATTIHTQGKKCPVYVRVGRRRKLI